MLFTVVGTQNVGKSTFIKDFIKEIEGWESPSINYRGIILSRGLKLNREGNAYSQDVLFNFILNDTENHSGKGNINTILDRSIIDAHVYTVWLYRNKPDSGVTKDMIDDQFEKIKQKIGLYDKVFYIPLNKCENIKIEDDTFRDTDPEYRRQIDQIFSEVIDKLHLNNIVRLYGDREQRVNMAWDSMR